MTVRDFFTAAPFWGLRPQVFPPAVYHDQRGAAASNFNSRQDIPLVVSGSNFGQNLGRVTNASGTVGAAIVGTRRAPAIAVSVGVRPDEAEATPIPYPSTLAAFGPAAEFIVHLVDALVESRTAGSRLLPDGTFLNVNYPALDVSNIRGVSMARLGPPHEITRDRLLPRPQGEGVSSGGEKISTSPERSRNVCSPVRYVPAFVLPLDERF